MTKSFQFASPDRKRFELRLDHLFRSLVEQSAFGVELVLRLADHHFRFVQNVRVQEHEHLTQVVLHPCRSDHTHRGAHDRDRLLVEDLRTLCRA